ncbi:MAG: HD domain-containing protein [Deltaproteobacteria bacterium]|nr:HD domain-containing protein [Deltaproteobacteria bacterium]
MGKNIFIDQLKEGGRVDELFLVKSARLSETKAGKPYLILTVMDRSGELGGPVWENALQLQKICRPGEIVRVGGMVQSYRDSLQLKIDSVQPVAKSTVELGDYFPVSPKNRQQMADELQTFFHTIKNPYLKKLLNYFFDKSDWWIRFQDAPAAKGIHHAYIGGLLEHSLSTAGVCNFLAEHYEGVDHSLLVAGALLHDIGKLEELEVGNGVVEYTVRGRLKGHLVIGSEMIAEAAGRINNFPKDLLEQLQHLILSHHGRQEFGSPAVPMTVEALVLSFADDLDAKMNLVEQLRRKMNSVDLSWTEYQRTLERYLYLGGFEKKPVSEEKKESSSLRHQPSLFS